MKGKLIISVAVLALISICSAAAISQSALSSIIQDIMSPAKPKKAMQLINVAGTRSNKNIAVPIVNECGMPGRIANELPIALARTEIPGRISNEIGLPRVVVSADGARIFINDPRVINSNSAYPTHKKVEQYPGNLIDFRQILASVSLSRENVGSRHASDYAALYSPVPIPTNSYMPMASPSREPFLTMATPPYSPLLPMTAPNPYAPTAAPNPFLPAASPLSSYLPSAMPPPTQSRGQFLRKIPIPPPTI